MAAKVVMVAVPTVLGIASIRVYTVKEAPTDGLVTRERLNVYTPLPQSNQATFVPESPGVFESGVTTARESVLPFVKAVKGACISVKRGSVDLYHAGEDVFYYLKDPPPGFLPRFGTITMAGLLGMFLARKGSRFKRLAIPLGLMSAGASVCYPAQAVAVLKVTGKKVYAAGQWSRAAASSLLASKEPVAKETAGSQPQSATVPNPESPVAEEISQPSSTADTTAQSSTVSDTEVKSADPISDEPIVAVITEEESSVTTREISPNQAPTETSTEKVSAPPSMELPAPVEGEEASDRKQASGDVSSDTSPSKPASAEPETAEAVPVESASFSEVTSAPKASDEPAEGSSFKPDPSLMDFGQSSPEDEDLYSTRS
ncbi:MICOS complex subunit MIC27 isoform X2 [Archocentrus centrarchus]|uniref:MICOS complex subunit MIC27 isoform X2 n=1 Tax=Archocentrus centrarchus TaxID=63155 RepID=UPI0011E9EF6A|nr:MICOS complex subunit Mic27-like isoform X2 [Archocentrus centrarchus]